MKILSSGLMFFLAVFISNNVLAKAINLYDQPNTHAKMIGTIDSEKGLVPIFTPKDGQWTKIANPLDGTVGWAKVSDLKIENKNGYTISEQFIRQGNGPQSFIIKFGEPKPLTDAQRKEYLKKLQERQAAFQKDMEQMMQHMFTEFNDISTHFPVMMPVVLMPEAPKKDIPKPADVKTKETNGKDKQ